MITRVGNKPDDLFGGDTKVCMNRSLLLLLLLQEEQSIKPELDP